MHEPQRPEKQEDQFPKQHRTADLEWVTPPAAIRRPAGDDRHCNEPEQVAPGRANHVGKPDTALRCALEHGEPHRSLYEVD